MFAISSFKQKSYNRIILKIHSSRLRDNRWNLEIPLSEAIKNKETVTIGSSQVLRFISEINGEVIPADERVKEIRDKIKSLRKENDSIQNRHRIKKLYEELNQVQFVPDYMCLVIDRISDYKKAVKGFRVNGITYRRLLGTNGGVKDSTIVFVSERVHDELVKRIDNGRNLTKELIPAKFEAYRALSCSGSTPVSFPRGIAIVKDCITNFKSDVVSLSNSEVDGEEPIVTFRPNEDIELVESDGYGMMLPSLAERWSKELGIDYITSGVNTRFSWEKGMVVTFDYIDFGDKIAKTHIITDAWGDSVDLTQTELILTTSMVKLWDSYESCDDYVKNCLSNGYTFGVTKVCPEVLDKERNLNYQFIQSYRLTDEQIEELIAPTIKEIHDILDFDWRKTVLFLKGVGIVNRDFDDLPPDFAKAILVNPDILRDPFVKKKVYELIKKRINDAKIGVIKVHGNYSVICGDPYALCQSIYGLDVTGLLKSGEIYNKFWIDESVDEVACLRAPMTTHENIVKMKIANDEEKEYWYRYITTCTILNAWDTATAALNGADKDGDIVFTTNNEILVKCHREMPALMCAQKKAQKCVPEEEDLIRSNINSFGDDIGKITNHITSMYDIQAMYDEDSEEYKALEYRIRCGQLYQQDAIDKSKGIISKPMPKSWYDRHSVMTIADDKKKELYLSILAEKKPYFMRYVYPSLMREYNSYIKTANSKCLREFGITLNELLSYSGDCMSEEQKDFIFYFYKYIPVSNNDCVMNKICRRIEDEFDRYIRRNSFSVKFDYNLMKSGEKYTQAQYNSVLKIYNAYREEACNFKLYANTERVDKDEVAMQLKTMAEALTKNCLSVCSNGSQLCDIILDICYQTEGTKWFAWNIVGDEIIHNLYENNNRQYYFPALDEKGDVSFEGVNLSFIRRS